MVPAADSGTIFQKRRRTSRHPVKLTALLYLRDALLEEAYEECPFFIQIARQFGAQDFEIKNLLEDPRRKPLGN